MLKIVNKEKMVNVRLTENVHEDFKTVATLRGASMSSLLHQFIVKAIREEKEREPRAFESHRTETKDRVAIIGRPVIDKEKISIDNAKNDPLSSYFEPTVEAAEKKIEEHEREHDPPQKAA